MIRLFFIGLEPNIIIKIPLSGCTIVSSLKRLPQMLKNDYKSILPIKRKLQNIEIKKSQIMIGSKISKNLYIDFRWYEKYEGFLNIHFLGYFLHFRFT